MICNKRSWELTLWSQWRCKIYYVFLIGLLGHRECCQCGRSCFLFSINLEHSNETCWIVSWGWIQFLPYNCGESTAIFLIFLVDNTTPLGTTLSSISPVLLEETCKNKICMTASLGWRCHNNNQTKINDVTKTNIARKI